MTRAKLLRAGVVVACVFAGSLLAAPTAGAATAGFHVWNLTGKPLRITDINLTNGAAFATDKDSPVAPKVGDVLQPGVDNGSKFDHNHIELKRGGAEDAFFDYAAPDGTKYGADFHQTNAFGIPYHFAACVPRKLCKPEGAWAFFFDPPGTVNEIKAADPQKQADFLDQLCTNENVKDSGFVTCEFTPTGRDPATNQDPTRFGSPHLVGVTAPNCTEDDLEVKLDQEDKTGVENSVGVKFTAETKEGFLFGEVKLSIETAYDRKWTTEHGFKKSLKYSVKPGYIGWVVAKNPVIRDTGDFTLTIGNTTTHVRDVYFDSPDASRDGEVEWTPITRKMTDQEKKDRCKEGKSTLRAPASLASIKQRGTKGADALYGGRESTTLIARSGNDILRGGAAGDRLFGGPGRDVLDGEVGRDVLHGGPGRDVLRGGPGPDTLVDSGGRTRVYTGAGGRDSVDVRDGEGDDTVICGNRNATVKADPGDRVRHCGR